MNAFLSPYHTTIVQLGTEKPGCVRDGWAESVWTIPPWMASMSSYVDTRVNGWYTCANDRTQWAIDQNQMRRKARWRLMALTVDGDCDLDSCSCIDASMHAKLTNSTWWWLMTAWAGRSELIAYTTFSLFIDWACMYVTDHYDMHCAHNIQYERCMLEHLCGIRHALWSVTKPCWVYRQPDKQSYPSRAYLKYRNGDSPLEVTKKCEV